MQSGVPLAAQAMKYIFLVLCRVLPVTKDVLAAAIILCKDNHRAGDTLQPIREHKPATALECVLAISWSTRSGYRGDEPSADPTITSSAVPRSKSPSKEQ